MTDKNIDRDRVPENAGSFPPDTPGVSTGTAGSASGPLVRIQAQIDPETSRVLEARFKAFGCASTIAACSLVTSRVRGMSLDDAALLGVGEVQAAMGLPPDKRHCAELAIEALRKALTDARSGQRGQ